MYLPNDEKYWSPAKQPYVLVISVRWKEGHTKVIRFEYDYRPDEVMIGANSTYPHDMSRTWSAEQIAKQEALEIRMNGGSFEDNTLHIPAAAINWITVLPLEEKDNEEGNVQAS